jgi:hypothetical protein
VSSEATERLVENEAFFRDVNEQINGVAKSLDPSEQRYEYLCECSDAGCMERISLSFAEYEHVRASGQRFVLAKGHVRSDIEHVVERESSHVLVEKDGAAGELAADLNPRAA